MNEVLGKRDFSDTETAHLLNGLPLMEFSDVFSDTFLMYVSRQVGIPADDDENLQSKSKPALKSSVEDWYVTRYADLEDVSSYELLQ